MPTSISLLLLSGRNRFDDADRLEAGALRDERSLPARGGLEDEEADLVLWDVGRPHEAQLAIGPRQTPGCQLRSALGGGVKTSTKNCVTSPTLRPLRAGGKSANSYTLLAGPSARRRISSVRERTPTFAYSRESIVPTVFGVTKSAPAISLFERPSATSSASRRSVGVSSP